MSELGYATQVSIPYGFSNALRRKWMDAKPGRKTVFQSLMGFPMRCDEMRMKFLEYTSTVSIPYGFSNALRLSVFVRARASIFCFNPLWVFQCAATYRSRPSGISELGFNPLWVFQCAATQQQTQQLRY